MKEQPMGTRGGRTRTRWRAVVAGLGVVAVGIALAACSSTPAADQQTTTTTSHHQTTTAPSTAPVTTTTTPPTTTTPTTPPTTAPNEPKLVVLVSNPPAYEPSTVQLTQDGTQYVGNITWSSWSASGASGSGTFHVKSCQPNCAQGQYQTYPATLSLSGAQNTSQGYLFTSMAMTVPSAPSYSQTYAVPL